MRVPDPGHSLVSLSRCIEVNDSCTSLKVLWLEYLVSFENVLTGSQGAHCTSCRRIDLCGEIDQCGKRVYTVAAPQSLLIVGVSGGFSDVVTERKRLLSNQESKIVQRVGGLCSTKT